MEYKFDDNIYVTMNDMKHCIPGIIYIPRYELMNNLIENYDFKNNDMINLSNFYHNNKHIVKTFPLIDDDSFEKSIYNENYQMFNSIFDGAAMGQYLGGVDSRNISGNTVGFINAHCNIKYNNYEFKWLKKNNYYFPHLKINDVFIIINNLHIHSKRLQDFMIFQPIENKCITILH